jgi:hypothetical protein
MFAIELYLELGSSPRSGETKRNVKKANQKDEQVN